jgi:glucokinase
VASTRVIGVDLGGTKILAGIVDDEGAVERRRERPTPVSSQEDLLRELDAAVAELVDDGIAAVGFGIPSRLDPRTRRVQGSVNIPLHDLDLRNRMADRLGLPVTVENDANAAALAEFRAGAGRGSNTMVMLTLGTGCGGGVVVDGSLYRGWAEFGHTVVEFDGLPCQGSCTGRGHLEAYVTGHAATSFAQAEYGSAADSHRLVRLANEGETRARELLEGIGRYLGAGIASLVNIFTPEVVVIGGGFATAAGEYLLGPAREVVLRDALTPVSETVRIVNAELGTAAGLVGAGLVAAESARAATA